MYCLKCRRVTETEKITTSTSKYGRLMRRDQCITCAKSKTQFKKRGSCCWKFSYNFGEPTPFRNAFTRKYLYWSGNKTL